MRRWLTGWLWLSWVFAMPGFAGMPLRLPSNVLMDGMAVGASTLTYEPAVLGEALEAIRRGGGAVVEIHSGQVVSTNQADVVVGQGMSEEQTLALRRHATGMGMYLVAARVRFGNNASAITRLFEWADRLGLQVLVGDPPVEQLDHVERLVRQYNIAVGLPTGAPRGSGSRTGWTDPKAVMASLRGRDTRIGVVLNVLNLVRAGGQPMEALETLRSRLVGVQWVDVSDLSPTARPVPLGTGKLELKNMLAVLQSQRFDGYLVLDPPSEPAEFKADLSRAVALFRREMESIRRASSLRQAASRATVPDGMKYEVLLQGDIPEPVRLALCPDGSVWFASRRGMIWAWSPTARTNGLVVRLPVSTSGQRGLYGFEFDPGFLTNGHVYVYRAPILSAGNSNRVSRFTATGGPGSWRVRPETERVLLEIPSANHGLQQGGGFLRHPEEDLLYVGTGDNLSPNETPRVYDDPKSFPQDLGDLRGKILRIGLDGSVPADNPFVSTPGARPEVFALGLRNPVSLTWHGLGREILAGDVGFDRLQDQEEINRVRPGLNFGWPRCDGRQRDTLSGAGCPLADAVGPWFAYPHDSAAAVIVGPTVQRLPKGWPEPFARGLFYADYSRRILRFAQVDPTTDTVTNTIPVASGLAGGVLSMALTLGGELYLVEYAGNLSGSPEDRLSRIVPVSAAR